MQKSIRNFACVFFTSFALIGPLQERISKLKLREPIAFWEGPIAYRVFLSATSDVLTVNTARLRLRPAHCAAIAGHCAQTCGGEKSPACVRAP
eukprot:s2771_g13.t1